MHDEENKLIDVVFCAIDFSDTSALALTYATRLARRHGQRRVAARAESVELLARLLAPQLREGAIDGIVVRPAVRRALPVAVLVDVTLAAVRRLVERIGLGHLARCRRELARTEQRLLFAVPRERSDHGKSTDQSERLELDHHSASVRQLSPETGTGNRTGDVPFPTQK